MGRAASGQGVPTAVLKTRDAAVYIGHFNVTLDREGDPFFFEPRLDTVLGTLGGGYYWTEHVKTEIEIGRTSEARTTGSELVTRPDVPSGFRIYTRNETTTRLVSVAQSYQFFHNAWFHPFVTGGVDLAWERTRIEYPEQRYYPPPIYGPIGTPPRTFPPVVIPAQPTEVEHHLTPRVFGGTGFKAYLTRYVFFRTDMRFGSGRETRSGVFRVGFGADF